MIEMSKTINLLNKLGYTKTQQLPNIHECIEYEFEEGVKLFVNQTMKQYQTIEKRREFADYEVISILEALGYKNIYCIGKNTILIKSIRNITVDPVNKTFWSET
jgi:hypothetical protein